MLPPARVPSFINPMRSMPAENFGRSFNKLPPNEPGGGGGGTLQFPFQIVLGAGTATFTVRYGTIEDTAPTDVGTPLPWTDDATTTIWIDSTLDSDGLITAATIDSGTSGIPADTFSHAYKLVGEVVADSGVATVNQSLMFSQSFQACGRDPNDPETTPGTYQYWVT